MTVQLNLFEVIEKLNGSDSSQKSGCMDIGSSIRAYITQALKTSPLSRYQVAARMSELLGKDITKAQLDAFSAESKDGHRFPLEYLPAFVDATGDRSLLHLIADKTSGYYIENADALRLELGRLTETEKQIRERKRVITSFLGKK